MAKKSGQSNPIEKAAGVLAAAGPDVLNNKAPVNLDTAAWARNLQGNILNGHGRNHTVNIFLRLPEGEAGRRIVKQICPIVTTAAKQENERRQFRKFHIPGKLFCNIFLSAQGYRTLGHTDDELAKAFFEEEDRIRQTKSNFLDGMAAHAVEDLGDPATTKWEFGGKPDDIHAMLLVADDDETFLQRASRALIDYLEDHQCTLVWVERGTALRTDSGEGIEHFGYVDGRSQPLFLSADFQTFPGREEGAVLKADESIDPARTHENLGPDAAGGSMDIWNPFEPLDLVLRPDPLAKDPNCFGSYFVFRKLEQNVRDFMIAEQKLADELGLEGTERERAGAMAVGRFRDGTPLVLNRTDGLIPPKENDFRYDKAKDGKPDKNGLKCPFQAHIRKTNPRGDTVQHLGGSEEGERSRRIARRGITYGTRNRHPNAFQALDDLPSKDVGLLFMCFQAGIRHQFAFMQRGWANNINFVTGEPGLDPVIGQRDHDHQTGKPVVVGKQKWRPEWNDPNSAEKEFGFDGFVKMKGGEFFFAPSIPYLQGLAPDNGKDEIKNALVAGLAGFDSGNA